MTQPEELRYSKEHEWVRIDGDVATVGITDHAQSALGDIVYIELPRVGAEVEQGSTVGVVESVKAVSDLYTPLSGEVIEVNSALEGDPATVNREPFGEGWMYKLRVADPSQSKNLLSAHAYGELVAAS